MPEACQPARCRVLPVAGRGKSLALLVRSVVESCASVPDNRSAVSQRCRQSYKQNAAARVEDALGNFLYLLARAPGTVLQSRFPENGTGGMLPPRLAEMFA